METPTRKIATRMIPTGQFPPGKLPPKKIPTQDKSHLDNSHPGKFPPGQLPPRKTPTRKIPIRTTPTQKNSHPKISHPDNSQPGKIFIQPIATPDNCHPANLINLTTFKQFHKIYFSSFFFLNLICNGRFKGPTVYISPIQLIIDNIRYCG